MTLEGKVAIVTGAGRGIGAAIARRFVDDGARVVIGEVDEASGQEIADELAQAGETLFVHCDVSERLDVRNMVAETVEQFGAIDILVNNAGIVLAGEFLELKEDDFDKVLAVNLKGTFLCSQMVARHMVERVDGGGPAGTIINMSSINAVLAIPQQLPYSVAKGGVSQLTKAMALALAPYNIRVNAIGPGSIQTDMLASVEADPGARDRLLARTPLGRIGEPHEIAAVAAFLAGDDLSYVTGQTIYADGGRLVQNITAGPKAD